ncbi:MAG: aminomethyltransferase family protein [Gammaproteobacteria bacterium]|nr:aminomethyltransferase family protein [Gammaproteobacteria bacterium]
MSVLPYQEPVLPTPLHPRTSELCRANQWVRWAGYTTVDVYYDVELEYFAVRNGATLFDLSPMIKYRIVGPEASRYVNRLITRDINKIKPGRVAYVLWCNDDGKVLDDGTLFRFSENEFRLCAQDRHLCWLHDTAYGCDVEIEDVSEEIAAVALQGPTSCAVLKRLGLSGIETLKPFELKHYDFADSQLLVSRTGFTGDLGYELWIDPRLAIDLWDSLMQPSDEYAIRPIGSQALDLVRIEAGFIAPHVDFMPADEALRKTRGRSPVELGLGRLVNFDKGHFNGKRALLREQEGETPRYRLVGLDVDGNKPARDAFIYHNRKKQVGHVTSAMWSPTCKRNIAIASLDGDAPQENLWVEIYVSKELKWEKQMVPCHITQRPFFNPPRRRATPVPER